MAYADFDVILSLTVSHSCEEGEAIRTSVEGISVYVPRCGVAILVKHNGFFVGQCSTCGEDISFTSSELRDRLEA
jgi:uncharacterized protein (DUF983 family)